MNEGGNIIDIDKDEGLAISLVTDIIKPRQLTLEEAKSKVIDALAFELKSKNGKSRKN